MSKLKLSILTAVVAALAVACAKKQVSESASDPLHLESGDKTPKTGEADAVPLPASDSFRYQMAVSGSRVYRIDTFTGRMWELRSLPTDTVRYRVMMPLDEEGGESYWNWQQWGASKDLPPPKGD